MRIKQKPEDFIVEEIGLDGTIYEVGKKEKWEKGSGDQLIFVLEKKNWDTIQAAKKICKTLHISQKRIGYAGTKDRKAWTTQIMSLWNIEKEQLERLHIKDMVFKPLYYSTKRINLGDLKGNRFTITIRDVTDIKIPKKIPNFFGEQRFGKYRPITHLVGKAIVNEHYKEAVELYLWKWFETEKEEDREARKRLEKEQNFKSALDYFPKHLKHERTLLSHLSQHPNDYVGALRKLPRKLLIMFVHAYQSYLFNKVLEERMKIGLDKKPGDILENGVPTGPIYGYEMKLAEGIQGEIEQKILEEEWLTLDDFKIRGMPELSSKGMRRPLYIEINDFEIIEKGEDYVKVRFSLPKGCYATTVLEQLY
ncbi:MAG: tRNA pseudouridine(13) synthase TruD [Candidatus Diapherotrites archaeon]|nr:tRNA pseudouridine(13) synthase TruD [Candidatus Diapherotrites archaeon]